jgi:hypothetical protein
MAFGLALVVPVRRFAVVALVVAILSAGAGSAAFGAETAAVAHSGSIPSSGPSSAAGFGGTGPGSNGSGPSRSGGPGAPAAGSSSAAGSPSSPSRSGCSGTQLAALLKASTTKWSAAVSGATSAADLELASGTSVIALGGWNGSDPSPTLTEFEKQVGAGLIRYYISGGGMGGGGMGGTSTQSGEIATWVAAHYTAKTVGSSTVYDLTQPKSS